MVGAFAGLGMGIVLALGGRLRGIGVATMLPLGLGLGMIMLPTVALGGLALRWRRTRQRLAVVLAAAAVLSGVLLIGPALLSDLSVRADCRLLRAVPGLDRLVGGDAGREPAPAASALVRRCPALDRRHAGGRAGAGVGPRPRAGSRRDLDPGHQVRGGRLDVVEDAERVGKQ